MPEYIGVDRFAKTMEDILGDLAGEVKEGSGKAVKKAAQVGRREVKKNSPRRNHGEKHYADGWATRTRKTEDGWTSEIGNKVKPGLAHLLEKGHAKVGGGRVPPAVPGGHIGPAADKAFDELRRQVEKEVGKL